MILKLFGKEWTVVNEEIAIYLSFLIVLTILINNLGGTLVNSFNEQNKNRFCNLRKFMLLLTLFSISTSCVYMFIINYKQLSTLFLQEKFYIRYLIFNLIFMSNILLLMSEKYNKYWYVTYLLQLIFIMFLNKDFLLDTDANDIICLLSLFYCLLLLGIIIRDRLIAFFNTRYEKRIAAQDRFYNEEIKKWGILNDIIFFRNVFVINLGSWQAPIYMSWRYWLYYSILLIVVTILVAMLAYKSLFAIAIFCISINSGYETLYHNYRDSKGFRKNFDENARKWLIKLGENDISTPGVVMKRGYTKVVREHIRMSADGLGNIAMTNPRTRNLVTIGMTISCIAGATIVGVIVKTHIQEKGITERHEITEREKGITERHEITEREKGITERHEITEREKTKRVQMKAEQGANKGIFRKWF